MNINALNKRLKEISDFDAEKEIYRFIKSDLSHLLLQANYEQIFIRSEDVFGFPLGYYVYDYNKSSKKRGAPYTMVDTGLSERFMFIEVRFRKITIGTSGVGLNMFNKENGNRVFGVQDRKLTQIINKWIQPTLKINLQY